MASFALFDTPVGRCGVAWNHEGVVGLSLPEGNDAAVRARLVRRCPAAVEAPPDARIRQLIEGIAALLSGEPVDLQSVVLDMHDLEPFDRGVYQLAREIPPGTTRTYGELAERLGAPGGARSVGQALGRNPFPIVVPCHRVVAAGGGTGGFSARGGASTKVRLLALERARVDAGLPLFATPCSR